MRWEYINGEQIFKRLVIQGSELNVSPHSSLMFNAEADEEVELYALPEPWPTDGELLTVARVDELATPTDR